MIMLRDNYKRISFFILTKLCFSLSVSGNNKSIPCDLNLYANTTALTKRLTFKWQLRLVSCENKDGGTLKTKEEIFWSMKFCESNSYI